MFLFLKEHKRIITKTISEVEYFNSEEKNSYYLKTKEVTENDILSYPKEIFYPSLFQQLIDKKFDIRVFYLDGDFFSMAILSQNRAETEIDFRN